MTEISHKDPVEAYVARVKQALAEGRLSISEMSRQLAVDRSALSERLNAGRLEETELQWISEQVGRPVWWLRYGVDTPEAELRWVAGELRELLARVEKRLGAPSGEAIAPEDDPLYQPVEEVRAEREARARRREKGA